MGGAPPVPMKIAIVGGGWAGLSAAVTALHGGCVVHVYESSGILGGRARSTRIPALDAEVDNGQHILLGAYTETLNLMRGLGLDVEERFLRLPLTVRSADGAMQLRAPRLLPAPLHVAAAVLTAKGLSWHDKHAAVSAVASLRRHGWRPPEGLTVQQWLDQTRQPPGIRQLLWTPLCIATLNTPPEVACAQLFATVLRDSLGSSDRAASEILIPRLPLSVLWPEEVAALWPATSLTIHRTHAVRRLRYATDLPVPEGLRHCRTLPSASSASARQDNTPLPAHRETCERVRPGIIIDDLPEIYDAVLVCTNTPSAARLLAGLPEVPGSDVFLQTLNAFRHAPIATLTLELAGSCQLPAPMLLLHEDRSRHHYGQWLFQGHDADRRRLHVVISDATTVSETDRSVVVNGVVSQLREQLKTGGVTLPEIRRHALIVEKRATFLAVPGLKRPGNRTPWPGIWVAGDWTDTGYPAVLEGAVRSGRNAVEAMLERSS